MTVVLGLLLLLSLRIPAAVGLVFLVIALQVFLNGLGLSISYAQSVSLCAMLFVVPLAAFLAGVFCDSFLQSKQNTFATVLPVLAISTMLSSGWAIDFLGSAYQVSGTVPAGKQVLLLIAAISAAIFCAGLTAFVAIVAQLLFELPARWLQGALRFRSVLALEAVRPLTIVLVLSLAFNLIAGLCSAELWPTSIAAQISKL